MAYTLDVPDVENLSGKGVASRNGCSAVGEGCFWTIRGYEWQNLVVAAVAVSTHLAMFLVPQRGRLEAQN